MKLERFAEFPRVLVDPLTMKLLYPSMRSSDQVVSFNEAVTGILPQITPLFFFDTLEPSGKLFSQDHLFVIHYFYLAIQPEEFESFKQIWSHLGDNIFVGDPKVFRKFKWVIDYLVLTIEQGCQDNRFHEYIRDYRI